jgi:hypothetical protein
MAAVVTKYGFVETAKFLTNVDSPVAFASIAVGTGSTTEGTDCSAMLTEITASGLARASAATVTTASSATAADTAKYAHTWTATGSYNVKECGVFNSSANGDMLCYATFASSIPMESADTLQVTWSVQVKAG